MIKRLLFLLCILCSLSSCTFFTGVFSGVEDVNTRNGKVIGGSPSKKLRKDMKRTEKKQARRYKKELKHRAKRLGTTKKR